MFGTAGSDIEHRLAAALEALAEAFPDDVAFTRHHPANSGPVVRVRSRRTLAPDAAFRLSGLLRCSGDELLVARLVALGDDVTVAVWRPSGTFGPADRRRVDAIAGLASR